MIEKPKSVRILGRYYKILYFDDLIEVDKGKATGLIDYANKTIKIYDGGRNLEDLWQTIFHEIFHGIADQLKLSCLLDDKDKENNVSLLALGISDVLFGNKWFDFKKKG